MTSKRAYASPVLEPKGSVRALTTITIKDSLIIDIGAGDLKGPPA